VAGGVWVPWLDDPNYFEQRGVTPVSTHYVRSIAASVEIDRQLANHSAVGIGLGFDVSRWHPNLFNPSYSLSMGWAATDMNVVLANTNIAMQVSRLNLRVALCPVELLRHRNLGLRPCARGDVGFVYVRFDIPNQGGHHTQRYSQLRLSPFVRLSWMPIAGAEMRFDAGVDLELYRPDYRTGIVGLSTDALVFRPPRQATFVALGLAVDW
jgi:hypothetical protein